MLPTQREINRWYGLIPHPVQLSLVRAVSNGIRFPVVPAGRRSGKTERFKRFLAKQAIQNDNEKYFAAAPTRDQAKKIFWSCLKELTFSSTHSKKPSETELKIYMDNGSEIHVIGLDKPQRIEGVNWTGGGIDEIADIKPEALDANIMPALNTVDPRRSNYRAWCWFLGVPDGLNHYYRMAQQAESDSNPEYALFHWKSSEILPTDVIEAAKRTMSAKQYKQEYEACHMPDTPVRLFDGSIKVISDLVSGDEVIHINKNGKKERCAVLNGGFTKEKPIIEVTLETGYVIKCSPDHKFKT